MRQSEKPGSDNLPLILYRLDQLDALLGQLQEDHDALEKGLQSHGTLINNIALQLDGLSKGNQAGFDTRITTVMGSLQESNRRVLNLESDTTILKQMLASLVETMAQDRAPLQEKPEDKDKPDKPDEDEDVKIESIRGRYVLLGTIATIVGSLLTLLINGLLNTK